MKRVTFFVINLVAAPHGVSRFLVCFSGKIRKLFIDAVNLNCCESVKPQSVTDSMPCICNASICRGIIDVNHIIEYVLLTIIKNLSSFNGELKLIYAEHREE